MGRKTAAKYLRAGQLPSALEKPRTWRTRADPFEACWGEVAERLSEAPELEARALLEALRGERPQLQRDRAQLGLALAVGGAPPALERRGPDAQRVGGVVGPRRGGAGQGGEGEGRGGFPHGP